MFPLSLLAEFSDDKCCSFHILCRLNQILCPLKTAWTHVAERLSNKCFTLLNSWVNGQIWNIVNTTINNPRTPPSEYLGPISVHWCIWYMILLYAIGWFGHSYARRMLSDRTNVWITIFYMYSDMSRCQVKWWTHVTTLLTFTKDYYDMSRCHFFYTELRSPFLWTWANPHRSPIQTKSLYSLIELSTPLVYLGEPNKSLLNEIF